MNPIPCVYARMSIYSVSAGDDGGGGGEYVE